MGEGTKPKAPLVVEIDEENENKNIEKLDIEIPVMSPRIYREYKHLGDLDITSFGHKPVEYQQFSADQQRVIVFKDITTGEVSHSTEMDTGGMADYRTVVAYFAQTIMKDLRLVSGYDTLYPLVRDFIRDHLFGKTVALDDPNTLRNLSELAATKTIIQSFKTGINALTIQDRGDAEIRSTIRLRQTRPFTTTDQEYILPKKSVFNRIVGDSHLELRFAAFLDSCEDIISYGKNYLGVHFKLDYVNASGDIANYYPDFFVKVSEKCLVIVETKGQEDLDVPLKMARLSQWCEDINAAQSDVTCDFVFVDQESFEKYAPKSFADVLAGFRDYKET